MSEAAKERVIFLGTQFNKSEHQPVKEEVSLGSPKKSFWKRNTNKFPGSVKPAFENQEQNAVQRQSHNSTGASSVTTNVVSKTKASQQQSFEDFEGKTSDAWEDSDDDCIKIDSKVVQNKGRVRTISGGDVRAAIASQVDKKQEELNPVVITRKDERPSRPSPLSLLTRNRNQSNVKTQSQKPSSQPVLSPKPPSPIRSIKLEFQDQEIHKLEKFGKLLAGPNTDIDAVRKLSWSGIPVAVRPICWQLLLSYLPANIDRRQATLDRKRDEYHRYVKQYYHTRHDDIHQDTFRQIHIDIPRTNPLIPLFQQPKVQEIFERILYIWAMRHPASGYVQGINDLVTPFFVVFLSGYVAPECVPGTTWVMFDEDGDLENYDITTVPQGTLDIVEADSFWGVSKLLDGIQDNYTFAQPGIQIKVNALRELIHRIDAPLHLHLERHHVEYLQFAFRWMNNLLMREMPLRCTIRLWDTYLAEESGFATFHLYVCAALLVHFSKDILRENDFQGLMLLLQNLPTGNWGDQQIGLLLAEAFRLKYMFADAPKHLQGKS